MSFITESLFENQTICVGKYCSKFNLVNSENKNTTIGGIEEKNLFIAKFPHYPFI